MTAPTVHEMIFDALGQGVDVGTYKAMQVIAQLFQDIVDGGAIGSYSVANVGETGGAVGVAKGTVGSEHQLYSLLAGANVTINRSGDRVVITAIPPEGFTGTVWRAGNGAPDNGTGVDGDFYLDATTGDVYERVEGEYAAVANIKGATGATGSTGAAGADGATWTAGAEVPDNSSGSDGDFFLLDTGVVYEKIAGTWTATSINLTGPQGPQGETGEQGPQGQQGETGTAGDPGAVWFDGAADPTDDVGIDGDYYLNHTSGDVFRKVTGAWALRGNIRGPQGPQGIPGSGGGGGGGAGQELHVNTAYFAAYDGQLHTIADWLDGGSWDAGQGWTTLEDIQGMFPKAASLDDDLNVIAFQTMADSVSGGETIVLEGDYVFGASTANVTSGIRFVTKHGITLRGGKQAIIRKDPAGSFTAIQSYNFVFNRCNYIRVEGIDWYGETPATTQGVGVATDNGVLFESANNFQVTKCRFYDYQGSAIMFRTKENVGTVPTAVNWSYGEISHCFFKNCESISSSPGGADLIRIFSNDFSDMKTDAIKISTKLQNAGRIDIFHNTVRNTWQAGIEIQNQSNVHIRDNLFMNIANGWALKVMSNNSSGDEANQDGTDWGNVTISGNTYFDCIAGIQIWNGTQFDGADYLAHDINIDGEKFYSMKEGADYCIRVGTGWFEDVSIKNITCDRLPSGCKAIVLEPDVVTGEVSDTDTWVVGPISVVDTDEPIVTMTLGSDTDRNLHRLVLDRIIGPTNPGEEYQATALPPLLGPGGSSPGNYGLSYLDNFAEGAGEVNTLASRGGGFSLALPKSGSELRVKSIVQGAGITITEQAETITITNSGGGGGSVTLDYTTPDEHGAVGNGTTNDAAALAAAAATGKAVKLLKGKIYYIASQVTFTNDTVIFGEGWIANANNAPIRVNHIWQGPQTISAIATETRLGRSVSKITYSGTALTVGEVINIVSDTKVNFESCHWSESVSVIDVSGNTAWVDKKLIGTYTNPRFYKQPPRMCIVKGITFTTGPFTAGSNKTEGWDYSTGSRASFSTLWCTGVWKPDIDVYVDDAWSRAIAVTGAWFGRINLQCHRIWDNNSINVYGYGITLFSACRGTQISAQGTRCRHIIDVGCNSFTEVNSEDRAKRQGPNYDIVVRDTDVIWGMGGSAIQVHAGVIGITFENCNAWYMGADQAGNDVLPCGFDNRGFDCVFRNCRVYGAQYGFRSSAHKHDYSDVEAALGHNLTTTYINCLAEECTSKGFGLGLDAHASGQTHDEYLFGCVVRNIVGVGFDCMQSNTSQPLHSMTLVDCKAFNVAGPVIEADAHCWITVQNLLVDNQSLSGSAGAIIAFNGAQDREARVNNVSIHHKSGGAPSALFTAGSGLTINMKVDDVYEYGGTSSWTGGSGTINIASAKKALP
jgi:hypothetical protein